MVARREDVIDLTHIESSSEDSHYLTDGESEQDNAHLHSLLARLDDSLRKETELSEKVQALRVKVQENQDKLSLLTGEVNMLRNATRLLRHRLDSRLRHDTVFFQSFRRRFADSFEVASIKCLEPHHLLFLGHLLDLPVSRD